MHIDKIICPGSIPNGRRQSRVFVHITYSEAGNLSLTGVVGPTVDGNAAGSCGQIVDSLSDITHLYPGWTQAMLDKLIGVWNKWHLNDMNAGSPNQTAYLDSLRDTPKEPKDYDSIVAALADVGLLDDEGCWYDRKTREVLGSVPDSAVEVWENYKALHNIVLAQATAYYDKAQTFAKEAAAMLEVIDARDGVRTVKLREVYELAVRAYKSLSFVVGSKWIPARVSDAVRRGSVHDSSDAYALLLALATPTATIPEYTFGAYLKAPPSEWDVVGSGFHKALTRTHRSLKDLEQARYDLTYSRGRALMADGCLPYHYGSAWHRVEVPDDVLEFLGSLPLSAFTPAWV